MTKEDFEKQLLEDILTGKVEENVYGYIGYIEDNLTILQEHKDYFRQYFINDPYYAYCYAKFVDKGPRDDTREASIKDLHYAYYYALKVDKYPRDDTRLAACKDPQYAYCYALKVDNCSRYATREVACKDPYYAYKYARFVDKCFRDDTFNAVKGFEYEELYLRGI